MGGASASPSYIHTIFGSSSSSSSSPPTVNPTKLGLIISIYYLGSILGAFLLGHLGDHIGRINATFLSATFALVGGALQAASQNMAWIMGARVVTGMGTGGLMAGVPVCTYFCFDVGFFEIF